MLHYSCNCNPPFAFQYCSHAIAVSETRSSKWSRSSGWVTVPHDTKNISCVLMLPGFRGCTLDLYVPLNTLEQYKPRRGTSVHVTHEAMTQFDCALASSCPPGHAVAPVMRSCSNGVHTARLQYQQHREPIVARMLMPGMWYFIVLHSYHLDI